MITVTEHALKALGFSGTSAIGAVQTVREKVYTGSEPDVKSAVNLINKLLGTNVSSADVIVGVEDPRLYGDFGLMVAQAVAEAVVKNINQPVDEVEVLVNAKARATKIFTAPQHKWMFAKPEVTVETSVAVADGIETKVAVKADGSIKKGGKEVLAAELYKKYVASLNGAAYDNQTFIKILVDQLGMTKPGATTYNFNCKKRFNPEWVVSKKK